MRLKGERWLYVNVCVCVNKCATLGYKGIKPPPCKDKVSGITDLCLCF